MIIKHKKILFTILGIFCIAIVITAIVLIVVFTVDWDDSSESNNELEFSKEWWETTVFYQIYPRSFKDTDGDGIGDLKGVTENLEHFVEAGIGAVWLSPIFKSPMVDFGYDISDFYEIHDEYGTMEDFEEMVDRAHALGLKIILDFVPNHTSNESSYFLRSLNKTEGFEDFYMWEDGRPDLDNDGQFLPPTNWVSQFHGSAWKWSDERGQYYLHQFAAEQPDLNYRNPAVIQEMDDIMEFWLDKGADGFRVDALPYMMEADKDMHGGVYPDDPLSGLAGFGPGDLGYTVPLYTKDLIDLYEIVYHWRMFLDDYQRKHGGDTRLMMTEAYANVTMTMLYYGNGTAEGGHVPFNFDFITELSGNSNARDFIFVINRWLTYMPNNKVPNWVFGNHDNKRMATRFGTHILDGLNMLELLLPGIAVTYQGDEIGMEDGFVSWNDTVDVQAINIGEERYLEFSRDPCRTPFHWENTTNAGFSTSQSTWLPVATNYETLNLAAQKQADRSHFKVYQALTEARKSRTLQYGDHFLRPLSDNVIFLMRFLESHDTYTLLVNVGNTAETLDLSSYKQLPDDLTVYISNVDSNRIAGNTVNKSSITLQGGESIVFVTKFQN